MADDIFITTATLTDTLTATGTVDAGPVVITDANNPSSPISKLPGGTYTCTEVTSLVAEFSADDTTPVTGQSVSFTDQTSGGSPSSWIWDFGDGSVSTNQNPTHTYTIAGTYTVKLVVISGSLIGDIETKSNYVVVGYDTDAQAFITAAGITGTPQKNAINQFVTDLKGTANALTPNGSDIWSGFVAANHPIYPYCPIDDSTCNSTCSSFNLIDPTVMQLTFNNFVAGDFTPGGVTGGSGKYASLALTPSSGQVALDDYGGDAYILSNVIENSVDFGVTDAGFTNALFMAVRFAANAFFCRINDATSTSSTVVYDSRGLYSMERSASNARSFARDHLAFLTDSVSSVARSGSTMALHARNVDGTIDAYSTRTYGGFCPNRVSFSADEFEDWADAWDRYQLNVITGGRKP